MGALTFSFVSTAHAAYMSPISDLITTSQPGGAASHIIIFRVHNAVPASGTIRITPENAYTIPAGFDFNDVDLAVSTGGPYADRELAAVQSAIEDGVIVSGNTLRIRLNTNDAIPANAMVRLVLGTGATHQIAGDTDLTNPITPGSYRVDVNTENSGTPIDEAKTIIAIVSPVTTTLTVPYLAPFIFNAFPTGTIAAGTNIVELSLETDKSSTCRYATSSGITYGSMTHTFDSIAGLLFYTNVTGLADGSSYTFYVRCSDQNGLVNLDDFPITFALAATPPINSSDGNTPDTGQSNASGGSGGSGGSGPFAGGSAILFQSTVTISGKAPANSSVSLLRDGKLTRA